MVLKVVRSCDLDSLDEARKALAWDFWTEGGPIDEVREIIERVRREGDAALIELTKRFDGADLSSRGLRVGRGDLEGAQAGIERVLADAVKAAEKAITAFHRQQVLESHFWDSDEGARIGQIVKPLQRIGVYIPGGAASYPSTAMMAIIPAKVAGVAEIVACVPPGRDGEINDFTLFVLYTLGIEEVYRVGGAQAIAAMAYGTESIVPVEKVVGPGNIYVTLAKKEVFGLVGVDMLAGPSELVILAEADADGELLAWDMMAQLEHQSGSRVCLVTDSETLCKAVEKSLSRIAKGQNQALADGATAVLVTDLKEGARLADLLAPEHLIIAAADVTDVLSDIHNAGAIFLGTDSPVSLGDYAVGVNHVLPTKGGARFASPLGVYDFIKRSNVVLSNPKANRILGPVVESLARVEGLVNHAESMRRRL